MTVARFPSLAHWGTFTALVEHGRVVGCEPFARDPAPSNMLEAIPTMVHSPLRIARPAIRDGWREGKPRTGADRFHEVSWDEALDAVAAELARVRETLTEPRTMQRGYVEPRYVKLLLDEHERGRRNHAMELWALFMLELWQRKFADQRPSSRHDAVQIRPHLQPA